MSTTQPENSQLTRTLELLKSGSTGQLGQRTKERQFCIKDWEKFLAFQTSGDRQLEEMVGCCARFCWRMKDGLSPAWLTMLGRSGTGKTHCARKVWDWARKRFRWEAFDYFDEVIYWPEMVGRLRDTTDNGGKTKFREMARWPVLFLDDIGSDRDQTGFATEQLVALLGQREKRWTILTSNLTLNQLASLDTRISDRIIRENGNEYIDLDCMSYALRQKAVAHSVLPPSDRE